MGYREQIIAKLKELLGPKWENEQKQYTDMDNDRLYKELKYQREKALKALKAPFEAKKEKIKEEFREKVLRTKLEDEKGRVISEKVNPIAAAFDDAGAAVNQLGTTAEKTAEEYVTEHS